MKKFLIILLILFIVLMISIYMIYSYKTQILEEQKFNKEYEEYYGIEILGTELISIINRTIDINNKNNIDRDEEGYYIDNEKNSIKLYIQFVYKEEIKTIQMEEIEKTGIESFVKVYSTASFKGTKIEYHEDTNLVKSLTFEEIVQTN